MLWPGRVQGRYAKLGVHGISKILPLILERYRTSYLSSTGGNILYIYFDPCSGFESEAKFTVKVCHTAWPYFKYLPTFVFGLTVKDL